MHNRPHSRYARPSYRGPGIWDRIKASLVAIVVGMFIICVAFGLLFWNEVLLSIFRFIQIVFNSVLHIDLNNQASVR